MTWLDDFFEDENCEIKLLGYLLIFIGAVSAVSGFGWFVLVCFIIYILFRKDIRNWLELDKEPEPEPEKPLTKLDIVFDEMMKR